MSQSAVAKFALFKSWTRAEDFALVVRGHGGLIECISAFMEQSAPTMPPWWRYAEKSEPNQAVMHYLLPITDGEEL